jgi:hypothetical protein
MTLSVTTLVITIIMRTTLSIRHSASIVGMLSVVMQNVVMMSVVMLNVVAS